MTGGSQMRVTLWGVRGSLPVSGPDHAQFGGDTTCIEVRCGEHVLIFDAGTGLAPLGRALQGQTAHLFLSHWHYDHVIGLPFFQPFYNRDASVSVWSAGQTAQGIAGLMRPPFFPIGPEKFSARLDMHDFAVGDVLSPCPGVTVRTAALTHPGGAVGYRVEWQGRTLAFVTDTEHRPGDLDPAVLGLFAAADLALYDASYSDETFGDHIGWGHSTWQQGIRLAEAAGVRRLGLIHHLEDSTDPHLAAVEKAAQARLPGAFCGRCGQVIVL